VFCIICGAKIQDDAKFCIFCGTSLRENQPTCPHCNSKLDKSPERKTKCSSCKNDIYVRKKQNIFGSVFLAKNDAIASDYFNTISGYGLNEADYFRKYEQLKNRFKTQPNSLDVIWGLFNDLILEHYKLNDLQFLVSIHYTQALFLDQQNKGFYHVLKQSRKMELQYIKKNQISQYVEISGAGGCIECKNIEGRKYPIDVALKEMPLPVRNCKFKLNSERGFCRCMYLAVFDD